MSPHKLRAFFIKNADRILYGSDISEQPSEERYEEVAERYNRSFRLLETDDVLDKGFFAPWLEGKRLQGLALPVEVLEKIYYKNALKIYPRVKEVLVNLGYDVD